MEFLDEEARPRFQFQSRPLPTPSSLESPQSLSLSKPTLFISISLSLLLFALSLLYIQSDPIKSLVFWLALSFLIGPFAPPSLTAGDIRVGLGPLLSPSPPQSSQEPIPSNRRSKVKKTEEFGSSITTPSVLLTDPVKEKPQNRRIVEDVAIAEEEEREWNVGDFDLLKKQMAKHPVGKPGRWEAITASFEGRHKLESVIKMAKSMGERKVSDSDSFSKFLKDRKPVDKRIEGDDVVENMGEAKRENGNVASSNWSSGEDIALLNALKAFPKDVSTRWEKIVAAVPGKTKAACMKRVTELKRDFRSSKASGDA